MESGIRLMRAGIASGVVAGPLRTLWGVGVAGGLSDRQLLDRFATGHCEAAELSFQSLVERHGPMVLGVCRRSIATRSPKPTMTGSPGIPTASLSIRIGRRRPSTSHLIDRDGFLRWDGGPDELDERIAALLDTPRPGK